MQITEKVAYLKGLMDGLGIDDGSKEGKVLRAILDVLDDMALTVSDLEDTVDVIGGQVEMLDEDLSELQEDFYEEDEEEDDDGEDYEGELYEVTCPSCESSICVDEEMLDEGEIACPQCGELLEFDLDGMLEGCGCGCKDEDEEED